MEEKPLTEYRHLPLDVIDASRFQSRKTFETSELEAGIKKNGFKGAILVRPIGDRFEIVYGERRYRSVKNLKHKTIPCIVEVMSDEQAHEIGLIENLQRTDLDPFEEAEGMARLKNERKLSLNDMAERLGKPRATIAQIVNRAAAPQAARDLYYKTKDDPVWSFKLTHIDLIVGQPIQSDQMALVEYAQKFNCSTRMLKNRIEQAYRIPLAGAFFDVTDDTLKRPACVVCPKRIMNRREKGSTDASGDTCLDPGCYAFKNQQQVVKLGTARDCKALPIEEAERILDWNGKEIGYGHDTWLALDSVCPEDKRRRKYSVLLQSSGVQGYLLAHPRTKNLIEAADRKEVYEALLREWDIKQRSAVSGQRSAGNSASDLQKRDEKRAKKLAYLDVAAEVADGARLFKPIPEQHWPHLWARFRGYDWQKSMSTVVERRGLALPDARAGHSDQFSRLTAHALTLTPRDQASLYYEIVWCQEARSWWEYNQKSYSAEATQLVEQLHLSPDDHFKRHLGEIRERKAARAAKEQAGGKSKGKRAPKTKAARG